MSIIKYVSTREELKSAMQNGCDYVVIQDKQLARSVAVVKDAKETLVRVALIAGTGAAAMWWNPLGWASGAVALTAGGTLTLAVAFLIVVLGAGVIWALRNNWNIVARGRLTLPDGTELGGELILSPR